MALTACTVNLSQSESTGIVKNQCNLDSDCRDGTCFLHACAAHEGALSSLLLELTPPVGTRAEAIVPAAGIGGVRFLQMEGGFARSNEQHDLNLAGVSTIHGYLRSACPLEVTLTPEEQSYGLQASTYVTHTSAVTSPGEDGGAAANGACGDKLTLPGGTQQFVLAVPPGTFDVYARPVSSASSSGTDATSCVPQLFHGIVHATSGISCYQLQSPTLRTLEVRIPWPAADARTLDGWTVDVLHPVTGEVLSQAVPALKGAPSAADGSYSVSVTYSQAVGDPASSGQELLRLSPPAPGDGPVVQFSIMALILSSPASATAPQKRAVPSIGPFPDKVHIDGWVWGADDFANNVETPVPSTVTFSATDLDTLPAGIFASYSTTAVVGKDGRLSVDLLPGDYLVRTVPTVDPLHDLHLAAEEWQWTVSGGTVVSGADQGGRLLLVRNAASVTGLAVSASGAGIGGASVQALAASIRTRRCDGPDASTCAAQPVGVLEVSLAESAFVPRTASAVTSGDGKFSIADMDCGGCSASSSAAFDVTVRPTDGTRLPWLLEPGVSVDQNVELGKLTGTLPIIQRGKVQVPLKGKDPVPLPGTLIRAYVIRDESGAPILDPMGLQSCSSGTYTGAANSTHCIRSTLQVAETRSDDLGEYELVLPSSLDAASSQ